MMVWEPSLTSQTGKWNAVAEDITDIFAEKRTPSVQVFNPIFDGRVKKYRWRESFNTLQCGPAHYGVVADTHHPREVAQYFWRSGQVM